VTLDPPGKSREKPSGLAAAADTSIAENPLMEIKLRASRPPVCIAIETKIKRRMPNEDPKTMGAFEAQTFTHLLYT
jgi:hypothetical protein